MSKGAMSKSDSAAKGGKPAAGQTKDQPLKQLNEAKPAKAAKPDMAKKK